MAKSSRNDYAEQVVARATAEKNEKELKEFDEKLEELSDRRPSETSWVLMPRS